MPSQNNSGAQHQKRFAVTVVATAKISANSVVSYGGKHADNTGGLQDSQGISEHDAEIGDAVSVVTDYSYLVVAGSSIAFGQFVLPFSEGDGSVVPGTKANHCGRALGTAVAGQLVEVQILPHVSP